MLKVKEIPQKIVHIAKMKDGDIAVIRNWPDSGYIEDVVQRCNDSLIGLGNSSKYSWPNLFCASIGTCFKVEILPKGTTFVLE